MAAKTPDTLQKFNVGSMTLYIATFSTTGSIDDGDTWASGIPYPIGYWGNLTTDGTQEKEKIDITLSTSATGAFTFNTGEDNKEGLIYVLTKSIT
jgi:hypothetical protein